MREERKGRMLQWFIEEKIDYVSQNVEYDKEILDTHQELSRSQRIRKPNPKSISIQIMYIDTELGLSWL